MKDYKEVIGRFRKWEEYEKELRSFLRARVKINKKLMQLPCTEESVAKRVALLLEKEELGDKKIIFLGDDDFVSLGLACVGLPMEIVMVDIDSRIVKRIEEISRDAHLGVHCLQYNLYEDLPDELKSGFDIFSCDSEWDLWNIFLWMSRGIECLSVGGNRKGYMSMNLPGKVFFDFIRGWAKDVVEFEEDDYREYLRGFFEDFVLRYFSPEDIEVEDFWPDFNRYCRDLEGRGIGKENNDLFSSLFILKFSPSCPSLEQMAKEGSVGGKRGKLVQTYQEWHDKMQKGKVEELNFNRAYTYQLTMERRVAHVL